MLQKAKRLLSTLLMMVLLVTAVSPMVPTAWAAYTDDAGDWYSPFIQKAQDYGLMNGYPDGSFGVGLDITRAEFATVLCQMFGWEPVEEPGEAVFDDVKGWAKKFIYAALEHGAVDADPIFRPQDPISREEMAVMLVKALGYGDLAEKRAEAELPFADVDENKGYIRVAYDIGMTSGVPGPEGTVSFLPHDSAKREEAATMLVSVYERYISKTDWLHGFYAFSSFSQIDLGTQMDEVSMGWARLTWNEEEGLYLNTTRSDGNEWALPEDPRASLDKLEAAEVPHNLNVYADTAKRVKAGEEEENISVLELLMTDEAAAQRMTELLVEAAQDHAGLTIDFEGLKDEQWREPFAALLARLREALPADKTLYVCVPPDTWYHSYDYRALGEICDKVILMAHDYQFPSIPEGYVGTTKTYSPVTPLSDIYTALQHLTDRETGVQDKSKAVLQISFGTAGFKVDEEGLIQNTTIYHPASTVIATRLEQEDTVYTWDEVSRNPYIIYTTEEGNHYKLWFENAPAVREKLALARMFGVTGVSVWRLGTIPNFPEIENYDVWQVFTDR